MPLCNDNNKNILINSNIFGLNLWIWILIIIIIFIIMNCNVENFSNSSTLEKKNIKIYNFYADWCGYSMKFLPIWNEFEEHVKNNLDAYSNVKIDEIVKVTDNDCNDNNCKYHGLCEKYNINGFPTVIFDIDGDIQMYNGERSLDGLNNYLKNIN